MKSLEYNSYLRNVFSNKTYFYYFENMPHECSQYFATNFCTYSHRAEDIIIRISALIALYMDFKNNNASIENYKNNYKHCKIIYEVLKELDLYSELNKELQIKETKKKINKI